MPLARQAIVAEARAWIDTPYRHQASVRGVGADCLGLVRGVWRACVGPEPERLPAYTPDWAERNGQETLFQAASRWLVAQPTPEPQAAFTPGDVVLFRMRAGSPMKHCAIVVEPDAIIHAYWGRAVVQTTLTPWWRRRLAAQFAFPNLEP